MGDESPIDCLRSGRELPVVTITIPTTHFAALPCTYPRFRHGQRFAAALLLPLVAACRSSDAPETAVGTLEMVETNVGPLQVARAIRVLVREGDRVEAGDTLVIFSTPTMAASEAQAAARAQAAQQMERELTRGARPAELARAESELKAAEAEAERTAADLARFEPLAARGDISRAQLDAARGAARSSAGRRDAVRETLRLVREGPRDERRLAAAADARGAQAAAAGMRASANDLVLLAPTAGIVTSRNVEPGEVLGPGQSAISLGQPSRPWARIYVSQFVLPRLHVGDSLSVHLDGDTVVRRGRVASIATKAEFTPRVALTDKERADLLFGVKIEFNDPTDQLKAGLPITVILPPVVK